ncbi:MAG: hypothetical protein JJU29_04890 [Verrucomicrobia bacterium]|nr:hypothetical protein [Verrucomicrobiota bacterium]MCH8510255.1 hypothetical protein [Kiritimatiellia bacterium]
MSPVHTHMESTVEVPALERPALDAFDDSLGDVTDAERRRRRIAYLQDVALQMQMSGQMLQNMGCMILLRPLLRGFSQKAGVAVAEKFDAALNHWHLTREDLALDTRDETEPGKIGKSP